MISWPHDAERVADFLDHLLRYTPSKNLTAVRQSFFTRGEGGKYDLGGGVEAMKGVFQSIRTYQVSLSLVDLTLRPALIPYRRAVALASTSTCPTEASGSTTTSSMWFPR